MIDVDVVYRSLSELELRGFGPPKLTPSAFEASWAQTLPLLKREVGMLNDRGPVLCVIQLDIAEASIRKDGAIVSGRDARSGKVAVSFPSRHGPLRYQTHEFTARYREGPSWQHNVRAIALALEALRKVDRYGVGARGEQYTGWAQLGAARPMGQCEPMTEAEALRILAEGGGCSLSPTSNADVIKYAFRRASSLLHPDMPNGSKEKFQRLVQARDLLLPQGGTR